MNNNKTTGQYAEVNGISMYYEIHGEGGTPLVLIHGGGSTLDTSFGRILPYFAHYGKVIAVELQAHGRTGDRDAPETFEQDADDVAALLSHLKINKANILGYSNGGTTTLQFAIRHPQLVNKIIVIAGGYKRDGFFAGFFDFMQDASMDNMPALLKDAFIKVNPDKAALQTMFEKDKARMIGFKDYSDEAISSIQSPGLFMVADKDVITVEHTQKMSSLVAGSELVVLPGTHGAFFGAAEAGLPKSSRLPEVTAILVNEFLAK